MTTGPNSLVTLGEDLLLYPGTEELDDLQGALEDTPSQNWLVVQPDLELPGLTRASIGGQGEVDTYLVPRPFVHITRVLPDRLLLQVRLGIGAYYKTVDQAIKTLGERSGHTFSWHEGRYGGVILNWGIERGAGVTFGASRPIPQPGY